jgi:hypothetical protein
MRAQPVDATPSDMNVFSKGGVFDATNPGRLSSAQRADLWRRWKVGQSLHEIGQAFGKSHVVIHFLLARHDGIAPAARRRSERFKLPTFRFGGSAISIEK